MKKLVVGLGNPGKKYENTRHNIGFLFLDYLAKEYGLSWKEEKKFKAQVAVNGDLILAKPQTFMNLSGTSVAKLVDYYDVTLEDLVVVHDDVDLESLNYKYQLGRGSAGHNGVKDIISKLGSNEFWRLRIGVGRPGNNRYDVNTYVLSKMEDLPKKNFSEFKTLLNL
jgi:PTH1 family peptidyl-tRNA hydrolase